MSFILDALKKSEIERQRQSAPGLVGSGIAPPRPRLPVWALALGALLAVNLLVLMFVLTRGGPAPRPPAPAAAPPRTDVPASTIPPAAAGRETATNGGHFSPLDAAPVYAPEIPMNTAPLPAASKPLNPTTPAAHTARRQDPLLVNDYQPGDDEVLPTINEISLSGGQALPDLHLDVHVYATNPADRFVYVNMRKYHEGATLAEGPVIERIRRDGIILNYQGLRFLVPRQ